MEKIKGIIYAIISASTFGLIPMFAVPVQNGGDMSTISILFYRFLFGMIIMGALGILAGRNFKVSKRELGLLALFGINYVITALGLLYSYSMISSGIATTIHSLYPITVTMFAVVFLREKVSKKTLLAIVGSIVGVFLMCWSGDNTNIWGILLVSLTVFTYTFYLLMMSRSSLKKLDPMVLNFYVLTFGAIVVYIISLFGETGTISVIVRTEDFVNLILLALIPTVVSNIMLIMAVKTAGATRTAIMGSFEPATAIFVGIVYFKEPLEVLGIIGFTLIIFSTIIIIINTKKTSSKTDTELDEATNKA